MNKLLILISFFFLSIPSIVTAQEITPSTHQVQPQHVEERIQEHKKAIHTSVIPDENHKKELEKKHQQVQEHLKSVKNKHHAQVAERIHENLNHVNEKLTTAWANHLSKMSEILIKLEDHLNQAMQEGKDITSAQTALADAKQAVTAAENALQTQASKTYTFTITNPAHIGPDVQAARDTLHTDLTSVHEILNNARKNVVDATKAVNQIGGNNHGN